jgi:type I restriction enzyme S subunit
LDRFTELKAELEIQIESERGSRLLQFQYYRSQLLEFDASTPYKGLGTLADNLDGRRRPVTKADRTAGEIPYYGASGIVDYVSEHIFDGEYLLISEDGANLLARSSPIAFSISGKSWVNNHAHVLRFNNSVDRRFVEIYLNSIDLAPYISGAAQPKLNKANLNKIPVPDPPFEQKELVASRLDALSAAVGGLRAGLASERVARREQYAYYRDRLLTFEETVA